MSAESKPKGILRKIFGSKSKAEPLPSSPERILPPSNEDLRESRPEESSRRIVNPRYVQRRPRKVKLHNPDEEEERSSSSLISDAEPRQRSPAPYRDPELDRAQWREEERQRRRALQERQDNAAKEQEEAQARAKELHDEEEKRQQREQDVAWARSEGKKRKNGRPASYHAIPDEQLTDEQLRAQQRQYERDWERIRTFDRLVARQQEEEDRDTHQETQDRHARRQAADEERLAWRRQEDRSRQRRQREAGIPRRPRHPAIVDDIRNYDPDDFDQQGSDFVDSAIRNAERQEADRRASAVSWNLPIRGRDGLMRRNTIDGSQEEERNGRRRKGHKRDNRSG